MEIAAIPGIRAVPTVKARPVDPELNALFEIEPVARLDDDTYTGSEKKAAGAEETEEEDGLPDDDQLDDGQLDDGQPEILSDDEEESFAAKDSSSASSNESIAGQISFFA